MQKLILIDKETNNILDVIENAQNVEMEDRGTEGLFITWHNGGLHGIAAELLVIDQEQAPELVEARERKPAAATALLKKLDKKANFKKTTIQDIKQELAALKAAQPGNQPAR